MYVTSSHVYIPVSSCRESSDDQGISGRESFLVYVDLTYAVLSNVKGSPGQDRREPLNVL